MWGNLNFMYYPHENDSMWAGFWSKLLSIFHLNLSNPFIEFGRAFVRLGTWKYVKCQLNWFSIDSLCGACVVLEMLFPSFPWTSFLAMSSQIFQTWSRTWEDVNFRFVHFRLLVVDWANFLANLRLSQDLKLGLNFQEVAFRFSSGWSIPTRKSLLVLGVLKIMIALEWSKESKSLWHPTFYQYILPPSSFASPFGARWKRCKTKDCEKSCGHPLNHWVVWFATVVTLTAIASLWTLPWLKYLRADHLFAGLLSKKKWSKFILSKSQSKSTLCDLTSPQIWTSSFMDH